LNNEGASKYVFSTEGHLFPIKYKYFINNSKILFNSDDLKSFNKKNNKLNNKNKDCKLEINTKDYLNLVNELPIQTKYLNQLFDMIGVFDDIEKLLVRKSF
jgi:hypothetical protein